MTTGVGAPCGLDAVFFAWDSAVVPPNANAQLAAMATCLPSAGPIFLEAHGDRLGSAEFNILLSERRGKAVKTVLVEAGAPEANLQIIAKGSLEATGKNEPGRARDRRVQFISRAP